MAGYVAYVGSYTNNNKKGIQIYDVDVDECVLTQNIEIVKKYLYNNIKKCNIKIISGADHSYTDKYEELGKIIESSI